MTAMPVQQQKDSTDSGLFSIAFAYHAASGDDLMKTTFDQALMGSHLLECFAAQELTAFPELAHVPTRRRKRDIFIPLFCTCGMPECFDAHMVECDKCKS